MNRKRILIAEDEEKLLFGLCLSMEMKGYEIISFRNGEEALLALLAMKGDGNLPDLIICDMKMPKLSGEELIVKLKELKISIPILAISAYGDNNLLIRLMRLGCRDFIAKPFDCTELQEHAEMILNEDQNEKLEARRKEALMKMGEKVREVSHDFKNYLGGMKGYAEMIYEESKGSPSVCTYARSLIDTTKSATRLCDQFLKVNQGESPASKDEIEMTGIIEKAAAILKASFSLAEIKTSLGNPTWIKGDSDKILQVVLNLGINAIQSMNGGGVLTLGASCLQAPDKSHSFLQDSLCVLVSDKGCGILPEDLSKLFSEHFTRKENGHGIGLITVKSIMEEHEGWIEVKSEPGKGTEFKLYFPLAINDSFKK